MIVIDSSIVIEIERGNKLIINEIEKIKKRYLGPAIITFITYFEVIQGILKRNPKNKEEIINFLDEFTCINPTKRTAELLVELKVKYDEKGIQLPLADLLIASQVHEGNHIFITKDKDFSRIEEINKVILQ
ncbi:type II toxin-antitoxin system VapC family toxin [Candidatus Woesearchaeota archaeon]|nr:type II toxin-antitoxin system VapC family toxin [Candidatus Woesearchaeota archaeon]